VHQHTKHHYQSDSESRAGHTFYEARDFSVSLCAPESMSSQFLPMISNKEPENFHIFWRTDERLLVTQ